MPPAPPGPVIRVESQPAIRYPEELNATYRPLELLGVGGRARFLAEDPALGRPVAIELAARPPTRPPGSASSGRPRCWPASSTRTSPG